MQKLSKQPQGKPSHNNSPADSLPPDSAELQHQLRLSRAQCAYLHRELATALKQAPLAPEHFASDVEALVAENTNLRERLANLTRHYTDLQQRYKVLEFTTIREGTLVEEPVDLAHMLNQLIALCHPDKWSQGQLATALAHE